DTPTPGEFEGVPSGLEVDYDAFADWEDKVGTNGIEDNENGSIYNYTLETSKRSVCEAFFSNNGIPIIVDDKGVERTSSGDRLENNGEEFAIIKLAQRNMIHALNRDDSDPRNTEIARNLVECTTSLDSPERAQLLAELEGVRDGSIDPESVIYNFVELNTWERNPKRSGLSTFYRVTTGDGTPIQISAWYDVTGSGLWRTTETTLYDEEGNRL
ncbi:hypothetical protein B7Z00_01005, partial [Candidatus Saccharibacteria bacterium 32-50-10]